MNSNNRRARLSRSCRRAAAFAGVFVIGAWFAPAAFAVGGDEHSAMTMSPAEHAAMSAAKPSPSDSGRRDRETNAPRGTGGHDSHEKPVESAGSKAASDEHGGSAKTHGAPSRQPAHRELWLGGFLAANVGLVVVAAVLRRRGPSVKRRRVLAAARRSALAVSQVDPASEVKP